MGDEGSSFKVVEGDADCMLWESDVCNGKNSGFHSEYWYNHIAHLKYGSTVFKSYRCDLFRHSDPGCNWDEANPDAIAGVMQGNDGGVLKETGVEDDGVMKVPVGWAV
ncbi:hypothetical protein LTR05_007974 [Lithohypha guttulata]|uniref:Uncharacterized protein n=1 Tax=Lithohypha guttulata TaxID=1690604 RepID=A0AAN7Y3Q6_9EURO|nr:hypothetical protein LTR05_007974 [Lithohypha guttulata]